MRPEHIEQLPVPRYVTSDTHFGHDRIRELCPWRQTWSSDLAGHDQHLINAWNKTVDPNDVVLHLGDLAFGTEAQVRQLVRSLNGRIVLVLGNHDRSAASMLRCGVAVVCKAGVIQAGGRTYLCRHDPGKVTEADMKGVDRLLHGHRHGDDHRGCLPAHLVGRSADCGIDAQRLTTPVPWTSVLRDHPPA